MKYRTAKGIGIIGATLLCAQTVLAWTYTSNPICTVTFNNEEIDLELTYSHETEIYAIKLTKTDAPWADSDKFSMRFEGVRPNLISTRNHEFSADMRSVTASDTGFGNVLDGLQYNTIAAVITDSERVFFSLIKAYPKIESFRDCTAAQRI